MTTFVTSYVNYYQTPLEYATHDLRLSRMLPLLSLQIPLCIYVTSDCHEVLDQFITTYFSDAQITLCTIHLAGTWIFSTAKPTSLPNNRFTPKDTFEYMCYTHTKFEFMKHAADTNPYQTKYFCWVDFDIANLFTHKHDLRHLAFISHSTICMDTIPATETEPPKSHPTKHQFCAPGCVGRTEADLSNAVHWRFTGGFFLAHKDAVDHLWTLYQTYFLPFQMVWDVNFLAWLEQKDFWKPIWYAADHNDSIIRIPPFVYSDILAHNAQIVALPFMPAQPAAQFTPSVSSCVHWNDKIVINTRFVNYRYLPSGHCTIHDMEGRVFTKNVITILDQDYNSICSREVDESHMGVNEYGLRKFHGIEDIRLFVQNDQIFFLGTTVNYSSTGENRMILGTYDTDHHCLRDAKVIESNHREKNWIPFVSKREPDRALFIYRWSKTFQIRDENTVVRECEITNHLFRFYEMRGSSNFAWTEEGYLGLIHFSVDGTLPTQYHHLFVLLDLETYLPIRHSRIFCFQGPGIEFCIQILVDKNVRLWVTREDRDPIQLTIPLPLCVFPM